VARKSKDPARDLEEVDVVFRALANASRRHILLVLHCRGGTMTAGEIADRFGCTWPTTSNHLRILTEAGLVDHVKEGRERLYKLNRSRLDGVARGWFEEFQPR
jgi:DNA-binding transcriptional ArsR family regulator